MNGKNRSRLAPALLVPLLVAAIVMACGGGSVPSPSPSAQGKKVTPAPTTNPSPTVTLSAAPTTVPDPTLTTKRPVAGDIDVISTEEGRIEDVVANNGDKIRERETVRTNAAGSLTFNLVDKIEFCNMYENAQVRVKPSSDVPLHFEAGEFACKALPDAGPVKVLAGPDVELDMSDPEFIVSIGAGGTTIRSLRGIIDVRSISDGTSVLLGPMESTDTNAGYGVLAPVRIWEPAEIENPKLLADLPDFRDGLDVSMPDAGGSAALDRMDESGSINIGVPEGLAGDHANLDFVNGFLANQSDDWNLGSGPTQEIVTDESAAEALRAGMIDVFVSSADLPGLGQLPLFVDPQGRQFWLYYDPADPGFGNAQREYLSNVVVDETYRQVYLRELGTEPAYEGVDELFGLE